MNEDERRAAGESLLAQMRRQGITAAGEPTVGREEEAVEPPSRTGVCNRNPVPVVAEPRRVKSTRGAGDALLRLIERARQ